MATDEVVFAFDWGPPDDTPGPESAAPPGSPPTPAAPEAVAPSAPAAQQRPQALVRGQRAKLSDLGLGAAPFEIVLELAASGGVAIDVGCAGLVAGDRLAGDPYFVFYNQRATPCGGVSLLSCEGGRSVLRLNLAALPASILRLVVVAAVDGSGVMSHLSPSVAHLQADDAAGGEFRFSGSDFGQEKALMILALYRNDGLWRIAALGQGFGGGLASLLEHFGAKVA